MTAGPPASVAAAGVRLTSREIARAFLVLETTMAARLTRVRKIAIARIPWRVPAADELPDRLRAVLGVVHLLFTTGHTAPAGAALVRADLTIPDATAR